ncbi:hypothetical protein LWI29_036977 [Acer saccharum]|uniref:RNase H type-1 domain-containing protein n=1 Tax=Acer saccharum TaxID=4024 RepID=A0AA39SAY2_ACESA|nr:hypothetical protein LWI29_036977 [Acer saccharum]
MTSSSKLPASTHGVPPPSLPTSSGSRSASSYLPGSQKEDSAASSQSIKKKKRNREFSGSPNSHPEREPTAQLGNNVPIPREEWPSQSKVWTMFVDGASNQHGCGAGIMLNDPEGIESSHCLRFEFRATNDEAKYEVLLAGLNAARELGAQFPAIKSDSQLIVNQVAGSYQAKGK